MERGLVWASLGLGCVGLLCCVALAQFNTSRQNANRTGAASAFGVSICAPSFWWLAVALPLCVWAMSLPSLPPFSSGQGWGRGFLMGGGGAWAVAFVVLQPLSRQPLLGNENRSSGGVMQVLSAVSLFAALPIVCVPLLWMRHAIIEALLGIALGWVSVSLVLILGSNDGSSDAVSADASAQSASDSETATPHMSTHAGANRGASDGGESDFAAALLLNGSAFTAVLCAACALGVYRDFMVATVVRGTYSSVVVALGTSVALALLSGALVGEIVPRGKMSSPALPSVFFVLALPLGLVCLLAMKMVDDAALVSVVASGLLLGFLLRWLARDDAARNEAGRQGRMLPIPSSLPALMILVALCGFMLAYQLMQGFGVGLMLVAAWPVSILALPSFSLTASSDVTNVSVAKRAAFETAQTISLVLYFLVVLLLSRLYAMRFRADLRGANFSDQYAIFGFAAGAVVPALLASLSASRSASRTTHSPLSIRISSRSDMARLLFAGVLALALPSAMLALWGAKVVPAFFAGLALSAVGTSSLNHRLQSVVACFSLAISLAITQWAHRLVPLAEVSRAQRLQFLLWALAALVFIFLIIDYGARLLAWLHGRKNAVAKRA